MEIGAADAAGFHPEQNFAAPRLGHRDFFHGKRPGGDGFGMVQDGGAHFYLG